jgi:hypothetical protein
MRTSLRGPETGTHDYAGNDVENEPDEPEPVCDCCGSPMTLVVGWPVDVLERDGEADKQVRVGKPSHFVRCTNQECENGTAVGLVDS